MNAEEVVEWFRRQAERTQVERAADRRIGDATVPPTEAGGKAHTY